MNPFPVEGAGAGLVLTLAPPARILVFASLLVACLAAPADDPAGLAFAGLSLGLWLAACRLPARTARLAWWAGALFFLPLLALVFLAIAWPLGDVPGGHDLISSTWNIFVKSVSAWVLSVGLTAALPGGDFHQGLCRLPLPPAVSALLGQMVHQTGALAGETRGILSALAVRGASGKGAALRRLLFSLPRVWLPRLFDRADRLADTMELRGFDGTVPGLPGRRWGLVDTLAAAAALGWVGLAVWVRRQWGG